MATEVLLPKLGFDMTQGTIAEWLATDHSQVIQGQPLLTLESDKSTNEIESPASGVLRIIVRPGETRDVGTVLALIE